ncbi:MAG: DMT family transporter [Pseudomonadota bacterium]
MRDDDTFLPVAYAILAIFVLSTMDAVVKWMGQSLPVPQIVFLRLLLGAVFALSVMAAVTGLRWPSRKSLKANGLRALVMYATGILFFFALTRLPLAEAITFAFTAPFFMALIAWPLLGERILARSALAIGLGFVGIMVIVSDDLASGWTRLDPIGVACALSAAVCYSLAMVLLRKHSADDPVPVLIGVQTSIGVLIALPAGIMTWEPVTEASLWGAAVLIGALGTIGHLLLGTAFARSAAQRIASVEYTGFLWAILLGWLMFGEVPALQTYIGAAIIVTAALIVMRRTSSPVPQPVTRRTPALPDDEV